MSQKKNVQSEAPRYNLKLQSSKKKKKKISPYLHPYVLPLFCDEFPKGNQDSLSKGGGRGDHLKLAKFACKA